MAKRPAGGSSMAVPSPPSKRPLHVQIDPMKLSVASIEELDINVLQFQNRKLADKLQFHRKQQDESCKRIDQLEQRQSRDDAVLCIINRYWNMLDDNVGILLKRFDAQTADEAEQEKQMKSVTSFIAQLGEWDQQEMEDKLYQRVELSKRYIGKLLQAYDRLVQHHTKVWDVLKDEKCPESLVKKYIESEKEKEDDEKKENEKEEESEKEKEKDEEDDKTKEKKTDDEDKVKVIKEYIAEEMIRLRKENVRLHELTTELHQRHHETESRQSALIDKMSAAEAEAAELKQKNDELEYDLNAASEQIFKLERCLEDSARKIQALQEGFTKVEPTVVVDNVNQNVAKQKEEDQKELEEARELSNTRLLELESLQLSYENVVKERENLKAQLADIPEEIIKETTEYKTLHSQYSVLYNESLQIMTKLEDSVRRTHMQYNQHQRQIEQMESEELQYQKKMRTEMMNLEEQVCIVRKDNELLKQQNEQISASTEQLGPINREMRQLISQLRTHSDQQKTEIARYKKKVRELQYRIEEIQQNAQEASNIISEEIMPMKTEPEIIEQQSSPPEPGETRDDGEVEEPDDDEKDSKSSITPERVSLSNDSESDLKSQLKAALDSNKELKLLLDTFKAASKENRDKATLMAGEKRAKQEVEELKMIIKKLEKENHSSRSNHSDSNIDHEQLANKNRKIAHMEKQIANLKSDLQAKEEQENALLSEMDVTGEALDETRDQNYRLLTELKEKDDANINLMSERLKAQQTVRLLKEEKKQLAEEIQILAQQLDAQNEVVRSLEEKERGLIATLTCYEKESNTKQMALENQKRKAVECSQAAADLKLQVEKYQTQLKEAQVAVAEKTTVLEREMFKHKRLKEEVASSRKKLERAKKIEQASSADEVLMEEIKEYKEQLTCPSCKVKKKDAVLTKCFHVFCLDCLKVRYETRQRKCPKCNAGFGAHDYHRLYLT
ncbi:DgyrCDS10941 [Dimorphilus gyrociliatus]|uniref:E3 ubiquitin protein ligase n=1 Tax=Dimorphilus gyrociliatus TaxID=2664684 RepID=A0A7I8W6U7_9ANNE|nr:DgyrCDS10941 [Dimorphilus gyrociliatus]